jgi:cytochrome c oxidase subunit 2
VHAFWIPEARFKYDAIPDRTNTFDLLFDPGVAYRDDRCSEFCGEYHEQMRFRVAVKAPAAFRAWLRARQGEAAAA